MGKRRTLLGKNPLGRDVNRLVVAINHAPTLVTGADHGTLAGLGDDDHSQYFHLSQDEVIVGQPTFSPAIAQAPFILAANGQGQTVVGFKADQLNKSVTAGAGLTGGGALTATINLDVGAGTGITVNADDIEVNVAAIDFSSLAGAGLTGGTAGNPIDVAAGNGLDVAADSLTLTVPTSNLSHNSTNAIAAGGHTHAIDASAAVTGLTETLLKTDGNGFLQINALGLGVSPSYALHIESTNATQFRLSYNVGNYADFQISSGGNLSLVTIGDIILDPGGADFHPETNYEVDLGTISKKWLQLHAAELLVETLVAQDTQATIGGRILVGVANILTEDVSAGAGTIIVKYNNLAVGDILRFESSGKLEWMEVDADNGPVSGGYEYDVSHNLDGSGSNQWYAGDSLVNSGQTGDGMIDLFSEQGIHGSGTGPTIVGFVRTGNIYTDILEHWAIGNLDGLYGYGSTTFGVGLGQYKAGYDHITIDDSNGIRFYTGTSTLISQWNGTTLTLGPTGGEHINVGASTLDFKNGSIVLTQMGGAGITVGQTTEDHIRIDASAFQIKDSSVVRGEWQTDGDIFIGSDISGPATTYLSVFATAQTYNTEIVEAGDMLIGDNSDERANIFWDKSAGELFFRSGQEANIKVDITGTLVLDDAGAGATGYLQWQTGATTLGKINFSHVATQERFTFSIDTGLSSTRMFHFIGGEEVFMDSANLSVSNNIVAGKGIYAGNLSGVAQDNNVVADGDMKMLGGLSVGSTGVNPSNGYAIILNGLRVGDSSAPTNDDIRATGDIVAGSGMYIGSVSGNPGNSDLIMAGTAELFINETSNANISIGQTIHQGSGGDTAFAIKATGVAHGMTATQETDTYFAIEQWSNGIGGAKLIGWSEINQARGMSIHGAVVTYNTAHTSSAVGVVTIEAHWALSTGWTSIGTNANLCTWRNNGSSRATLTGDGRLFLDAALTQNKWDDYDDLALLKGYRGLIHSSPKDLLKESFQDFIDYASPILVETGVIELNEEDGRPFVNVLGLQSLTIDAIRQLWNRMRLYEKALVSLGIRPQDLLPENMPKYLPAEAI